MKTEETMETPFKVVEDEVSNRFNLFNRDQLIAFATYQQRGGDVIVPHVETLPAHRGQGNAARLMDGLLEVLRADGRTITPLCPFAAEHIANNVEHHDLVTNR
jgi:predicted GNAT family acetyltransferase